MEADLSRLLARFDGEDDLEFAAFARTWTSLRFGGIHHCRPEAANISLVDFTYQCANEWKKKLLHCLAAIEFPMR